MPPDLIGLVERLSNLTVIEAAELAKILEEKWGVSAAAPVVQQGPAPVEAAPEQTAFSVILTGFGDKKVPVLREVRAITGMPLGEVSAFMAELPKHLKDDVSKEEAAAIREQIEKAGGTVEIR